MTKALLLFLTLILPLHAESLSHNESMFEPKKLRANIDARQNPKVKCRVVCDKKIYKEQQITEAIEFYKKFYNYKK